MSLSRKHYEAVAEVIKSNIDAATDFDLGTEHDEGYVHGCEWVARDLANYFAADNERFDRARFLAAAGVES